jgi:hypothetical protein
MKFTLARISTRILVLICILLTASNGIKAGKDAASIRYLHPKPGSDLHRPETTVIVWLADSLKGKLSSLNNFITVRNGSNLVQGNIIYSVDSSRVIFKPKSNLSRGITYNATIRMSLLGEQDTTFAFSVAKSASNSFQVQEKSVLTENAVNAINAPEPRIINGVAVPQNFPKVQIEQFGETAEGYIFVPCFGNPHWILILKNDGTPVYYEQVNGRRYDMQAQPNGWLTMMNWNNPNGYYVYDSTYTQIDFISAGHGYFTDNHELRVLPNGNIAIIAADDVNVDMSQKVTGGSSNALIQGKHFQEIDAAHNVVWEWRCWDYFDVLDATNANFSASTIDNIHMNAIDLDYDGNWLISSKTMDEITKIDRVSGEIIWRFGGKNNMFEYTNETIFISYQHYIRAVPGRPGYYTLFDNGTNRDVKFSRAVMYHLDTNSMKATKTWEYRHKPDWYAVQKGACQPLENGHYWIDWTDNGWIRTTEVDTAGNLLLEMHIDNYTAYRTHRFKWNGRASKPHLYTESYEDAVRLIFNKFGDTTVQYYNIYIGASMGNEVYKSSTNNTWYDATEFSKSGTYYFKVTAVDKAGNESPFSDTKSAKVVFQHERDELILNGEFSDGLNEWYWGTEGEAAAIGSLTSDTAFHLNISNGGNEYFHVHLRQHGIPLYKDKTYKLEFDARADAGKIIEPKIAKASDPYTNYSEIGYVYVTAKKQRFSYTFKMSETDLDARVVFNCGLNTTNITLDNIKLTEVSTSPIENSQINDIQIIRDVSGAGIKIVNIIPNARISLYNLRGVKLYSAVSINSTHFINTKSLNDPIGILLIDSENTTIRRLINLK